MTPFIRLNFISATYAFGIFVVIELLANTYRIIRLTDNRLDFDGVVVLIVIFIIAASILFYWATKKIMKGLKIRYFSLILWLPYLALFIYGFAVLFPLTNPGEKPVPVIGLLVLAGVIVYPLYLLLINVLSVLNTKK
ncbi:hypothetical protein CGZ75_16955 [Paenibacillus herberti]|uniref:Uncharacterized protein n=1 Tax=Paenibacillus herberti TaxID=1619309 RepID=A0A229NXI6_9BACL|nr:hypothetical protein CGZ75_16955 [Paenibacillus herberti]